MLKPFSNYQKEQAILNTTTNKNNCFAKYYNCCHQYPYYHSHYYHHQKKTTSICFPKRTLQNPFFILIVALLSLCAVTVSGVVTHPSSPIPFVRDQTPQQQQQQQQPRSPRSPFNITTSSANLSSVPALQDHVPPAARIPNETFAPEVTYANESWWPTSIPQELFHSNRGTLQQQIIGVPPSWGVGCPTPGSIPPVRIISSNNTIISNNKILNYMNTKMKEAENDYRPYDRCPRPCPVITTINNILKNNKMDSNELNSPSSNNYNNNKNNSSRSNSINIDPNNNYSSENSINDQQQEQEEKNKHPPYFNQCLHYLQPSVFETLCKTDNQSISEFGRKISKLRLPFCCEHTVGSVVMASLEKEKEEDFNVMLEVDDDFNNEVPVSLLRNFECKRHLESLLTLDRLARKAAALFDSVLQRYDCGQTYSVHFRCEDCKDAYRRWVCASLLPYHEPRSESTRPVPPPEPSPASDAASNPSGTPASTAEDVIDEAEMDSRLERSQKKGRRRREWRKVRPCRSVCQQVEQRCPFFLPGDRAPGYTTQYAGEPTFLCLDPNIPETGEQFLRSAYGPKECCFRYCDTDESIAVMMMRASYTSTFNLNPPLPFLKSPLLQTSLRHGVCSTTTACDQQELLLNNNINYENRILNSTSSLNNSSTNLLLSSSSSTSNNNNVNNNNINNNNKKPHQQCSQLTNEEKVQRNCAVSPPLPSSLSSQQQQLQLTQEQQQSVKINNNNNPSHHHHEIVVDRFQEEKNEKEKTSSSGDVIDSRSAGVSFHIHYLNTAALVARERMERLLLLLFKNNNDNNNNNENITISNRLPSSSLFEWWWFSIVTIILRIIHLSCYFLALLPYMLLFLLVHTGSEDGYL